MTTDPWAASTGPAHRLALEVLLGGPVSRAELARRVDLSPGSVTRLTRPLLDAGLLVEVDQDDDAAPSRVGRPSQPLDVREDAHHFAGIKLTGDRAHAVLTTFRARTVATTDRPLPSHDPADVADVTAGLVEWAAGHGRPVTGVGVSLGARVTDGSHVLRAPFLGWRDVPFGALLAERVTAPVVVANDAEALTDLTHWFGEGRGADTFALLTIGVGVGYGLVANGDQVRGVDAGLGLLGHHPLDPAGPLCPLGHRGCATAMLTTGSLTTQVSLAAGRTVTYPEVLGLAAAGDPAASRVLRDAGRALGRLVAAAANFTLSPLVVLGGEGADLAHVAGDAVREGLHADRDPLTHDPVLAVQRPGFDEWARGAAVEAVRRFVLGR